MNDSVKVAHVAQEGSAPQAAGHRHQGGDEDPVISQPHQQGNRHGADGRHRSGSGAGDGTVEQACNGHRAGETRCSVADKIREHIEQPLRNPPLRHDHASDDKQGNRKPCGNNGTTGGLVIKC